MKDPTFNSERLRAETCPVRGLRNLVGHVKRLEDELRV